MDAHTKLYQILKNNGHSLTSVRKLTLSKLIALDAPVSVSQLAHMLPEVDRASIYRTVELFEKTGIVHRVWTGFKSKIELSEALSPHHHHFTCITCGTTQSIKSDALEASLHSLEHGHGFQLTHHSVELSGYCATCRKLN